MHKTLITIDMQLGKQLNLMLIFNPGCNGCDSCIVSGAAHCCQEGGIRPRLHHLTGIAMVDLDIGWGQLFQISQ